MTEPIKAIETTYNGIEFRSRTEARWAVFLDALGVHWDYEPEAFTDGQLSYLPDFWVQEFDAYLEIKPDKPTKEEMRKAMVLLDTGAKLIFAIGQPSLDDQYIYCDSAHKELTFCRWSLMEDRREDGKFWMASMLLERGFPIGIHLLSHDRYPSATLRIKTAVNTSRAYRFWNANQ